jgi:hypothetical protein
MMEFQTESLGLYQDMIYHAIKEGLTFEATSNDKGMYIIKYTGGY